MALRDAARSDIERRSAALRDMTNANSTTAQILHVGYTLAFSDAAVAALERAGLSDLEVATEILHPAPFFATVFYKAASRTPVDQGYMHAWYLRNARAPKTGTLDALYLLRGKRGALRVCVGELKLDGARHYVVLSNSARIAPMECKRWANQHRDHRTPLPEPIHVSCAAYEARA